MTSQRGLQRELVTSAVRSPVSDRVARAVGLQPQLQKLRARVNRASADLEHTNLALLLTFILASTDNCIDIGASHGVFLSEMVRCAPQGNHVAFEPIPELHHHLVTSFPAADVRCLALANEAGERQFNWLPQLDGYSGLRDFKYAVTPEGQSITVRTSRLDDELPQDYVPALIKIDVEGAEYAVLQGGRQTLDRYKPVLVLEYPRRRVPIPGMGREDLYGLLVREIGYRAFDLVGNGPYDEESFVGSPALNFLFHL